MYENLWEKNLDNSQKIFPPKLENSQFFGLNKIPDSKLIHNPIYKLMVIFRRMGFNDRGAGAKSCHKTGVTFEIPLPGI